MLNELTYSPVEIHELKVMKISEIEQRIESALQAVNYGFLYVCVCFGLIRTKYEKLNSLYQEQEYVRYRFLINKSKEGSLRIGKPELREKYRFQAEDIKDKNKELFNKIIQLETEMAKEMGLNGNKIFPRTFNKYLDFLYQTTRIKNLPEKSSLYEYSSLGLRVLEYPGFFQKISKEINIDNYRKKLLLFEDMLEYYGVEVNKKKEISSSVAKQYISDIRELAIPEMKAKYNPKESSPEPRAKKQTIAIKIKSGCLYFGEELILDSESMETLQSDRAAMRKLALFLKTLV